MAVTYSCDKCGQNDVVVKRVKLGDIEHSLGFKHVELCPSCFDELIQILAAWTRQSPYNS